MASLLNDNLSDPPARQTLVFLLLDGWGIAPASEANMISLSKTPTFNKLIKDYPVALLNVKKKSLNARYLSIGSGQHLSDENIKTVNNLTQVISEAGLTQIKISETERLAALTHFFNGGRENKVLGEDWKIISSKSNDLAGLLGSMTNVRKEILKALKSEKYNFLTVVIPSLDLAAQQDNLENVKKVVESLDRHLNKIVATVLDYSANLLVSAACGNAENIKSMATELSDREMTDNPVPLIIIGEKLKGKTFGLSEPLNDDLSLLAPIGGLEDLAPTILDLLNLTIPQEMLGQSLIDRK